jgi:hypothetical protein
LDANRKYIFRLLALIAPEEIIRGLYVQIEGIIRDDNTE